MTPEQEEQVRRALTAAAAADRSEEPARDQVDAPIPPHVAARLDAVLADLVAERSAASGDDRATPAAENDELAARRDRRARRWPQVAAAVVSVLALSGGAVALSGLDGGASNDATSADAGSSESKVGGDGGRSAAPESAGSPGSAGSKAPAAVSEPRLRSATLRRDVQRVVDAGSAGQLTDDPPPSGARDRSGCEAPPAPPGADVVDVLLDRQPATLVLSPASGGAREARVYSCADGGELLGRTVVRRP